MNTKQYLSSLAPLAGTLLALVSAPPALATFPGRNGLIAFQADTGSGNQIYTIRSNGHELRQITHVTGAALAVDWSPDGRRIVFEHDTENSANVAIMNVDGSGLVELPAAPNGFEGDPSFTPDGARIVFERFDVVEFDDAIWIMNLDGSDRQRIIGPWAEGFATDPNVSPDGKTLSFVGFDGVLFGSPPSSEPARALFTCGLDGSNLAQLTPFTSDVAVKQDWAPDGRHIIFGDNANFLHFGDSANIAIIRPAGTDFRQLTHYQGGDVSAFFGSYSPDGRWIVFRLEDHGRYALYKMSADGSHLREILGLSSFRPRGIDWGSASKADDDPDNEELNGVE